MRRVLLSVCVVVAVLTVARAKLPLRPEAAAQPPAPAADPLTTFSTEQEWIVAEIIDAVSGIARFAGSSSVRALAVQTATTGDDAASTFNVRLSDGHIIPVAISDHIWAPTSYAAVARAVVGDRAQGQSEDTDLRVRAALMEPSTDTLLEQSERVSKALVADIRSAPGHEAAALVVAALALREASGSFSDVRSELSRTTAHLVLARASRGAAPIGLDGAIAEAALTALAGRQRDALAMIEAIEQRSVVEEDRVWARTLRLRVTGDWRSGPPARNAPLLERLEYARALRARRGNDAFLDYMDAEEPDDLLPWQRSAYGLTLNIELANRFGEEGVEQEMADARRVWSRLHPGLPVPADMTDALNERSAASPAGGAAGPAGVQVLDWGRMAAFQQRHLAQAMVFADRQLWSVARPEDRDRLAVALRQTYHGLRLYPVVARWIAQTPEQYTQALQAARPLVDRMPFVVTAAAWNVLLDRPDFVAHALAFPREERWFTPYVPAGTLYDLSSRTLRPGCRRPPSIAQARAWAAQAPYDFWTRWSAEWYAAPGEPAVGDLKRTLAPVIGYDEHAADHLLEHVTASLDEQILTAKTLCQVNPARCDALASRLLLAKREPEAIAVYEQWIADSRDKVAVSNHLTWIVRYYLNHGNAARAMELARMGAATGSAGGFDTLADALDRTGAYADAAEVYRRLAARYDDPQGLGVAYVREGLRTGDESLKVKGMELLRHDLPDGMEPLVLHGLDATPRDGIAFEAFGPRLAAMGLQAHDVLVGMDDWRLRSRAHCWVATRLRHEDQTTLTVWRKGAYKQLRTRVPERWLGVALREYSPPAAAR